MNFADFDPIFPDLSFRLFQNIFGCSMLGFECHSELVCAHTISTEKLRFSPCGHNSFDSYRVSHILELVKNIYACHHHATIVKSVIYNSDQTFHQNKNVRSLYIDFTLMLSDGELGLPVYYQVFIHSKTEILSPSWTTP